MLNDDVWVCGAAVWPEESARGSGSASSIPFTGRCPVVRAPLVTTARTDRKLPFPTKFSPPRTAFPPPPQISPPASLLGSLFAPLLAPLSPPPPAPLPPLQSPPPPPPPPPASWRQVGQAGKDVVWVPTPQALVDKMLDMAKVTPQDFVIDLGSGDGRTVITAAKRGARAMGIEYNPDMVELSEANAKAAGVTDKATFVKADLFETDFSKAHRRHDVPAAVDQPEAAAEDPRHEARHAHRLQLLQHGGLGGRRDRDGRRRLHQLVHGAAVDRAGKLGSHGFTVKVRVAAWPAGPNTP